eukprot:c15175_g1_i1.p1 GENE.c15175_g1_i1~~c15175_g1_i1.p1  ORF type:complete len:485 (-),score=88.41 c15175_g1_i1:119-1573(-)
MGDMWKQGWVRVISAEQFEGQSVPLREVLDSEEWRKGVEASPLQNHYLTSMTYNEFTSNEASRVLSYRWSNKITLQGCPVRDPAKVVSTFSGEIALSVLKTPLTGWKFLWADALNHLNDPENVGYALSTMGKLYLDGITLPQYFLFGSFDEIKEAVARGWMHQELAYGELDPQAVRNVIASCANGLPSVWRGNPFYIPAYQLMSSFMSKRVLVPTLPVPWEQANRTVMDFCSEVMGIWYVTEHGREHPLGYMIARDVHSKETVDQCKTKLDFLVKAISQKQVTDNPDENIRLLRSNPSACWSVLKASVNTNFWEKCDAYYASTAVIGAACGLPILDPLGQYRKSNRMQKNPDGTLLFSHRDLDLEILNNNNEILRICWQTLTSNPDAAWGKIPNTLRGISDKEQAIVQLNLMPPGMHTLGAGPLPKLNGVLTIVSGFGFEVNSHTLRLNRIFEPGKSLHTAQLEQFSISDFENEGNIQSQYNVK